MIDGLVGHLLDMGREVTAFPENYLLAFLNIFVSWLSRVGGIELCEPLGLRVRVGVAKASDPSFL